MVIENQRFSRNITGTTGNTFIRSFMHGGRQDAWGLVVVEGGNWPRRGHTQIHKDAAIEPSGSIRTNRSCTRENPTRESPVIQHVFKESK